MAIDGSIWVLENDGTILKFTRGKADNFNISGLDKAFSSPAKIFTNVDTKKFLFWITKTQNSFLNQRWKIIPNNIKQVF